MNLFTLRLAQTRPSRRLGRASIGFIKKSVSPNWLPYTIVWWPLDGKLQQAESVVLRLREFASQPSAKLSPS
jgi:hypothetical protein